MSQSPFKLSRKGISGTHLTRSDHLPCSWPASMSAMKLHLSTDFQSAPISWWQRHIRPELMFQFCLERSPHFQNQRTKMTMNSSWTYFSRAGGSMPSRSRVPSLDNSSSPLPALLRWSSGDQEPGPDLRKELNCLRKSSLAYLNLLGVQNNLFLLNMTQCGLDMFVGQLPSGEDCIHFQRQATSTIPAGMQR